jgi:thiamine monophosphate synthase
VRLPRLLVITDRTQACGSVESVVAEAVERGARGVILRDRDLAAPSRTALAADLAVILAPVGGLLIVAGSAGERIHLAAGAEFPRDRPALVGRSCHTESDVDAAVVEGCDYVTVSPVAESTSKPGYGPALGPTGLAHRCRPGLPVYALGGVTPETVAAYVDAGAYGVAVMGPVMRDPTVVEAYLKELPS